LELAVEKVGDVAVVLVRGDYLDASVTERFRGDMAPIIEANPRIVLDLSPLEFLDSAGLGALLSCLRRLCAADGDLKLCGLTPAVRDVFEMSRMHRIFDIFDTRDEALQAFQS
jgi:anti-sigma B factor antagonist